MSMSLNTVVDLSEGRTERSFRAMVEAISEGAITLGSDRIILYSNRAFAAILGLRIDDVIGSVMDRFVATDDLARYQELVLRRGQGEIRIWSTGGTTALVHLSISAFDDSGECVVGLVQDITQRKKDEAERQSLIRRLIDVEENERRRVARDLHDQFGQQLSALALKLATLREDLGRRTNLSEQLAPIETIARRLDTDLDLLVLRLRPPALDDLGLTAALENYIWRWAEEFGVRAELHVTGIEARSLNGDTETALYRIVLEALNNVAKHAHARNAAVLLDQRADRVTLIIEDDGLGFEVDDKSHAHQRFGVTGMRERTTLLGGMFDIESSPGAGTTLAVRIPVPSQSEDARK